MRVGAVLVGVVAIIAAIFVWSFIGRAPVQKLDTVFSLVQAVNVSPSAFAVIWVRGDSAAGQGRVRYGTSPGALTSVASERSPVIPGSRGDVHLVQVIGLQPATKYYFDVGAAVDNQWDTNRNAHFSASTASVPESIPAPRLFVGRVYGQDGKGAAGTAVILRLRGRNANAGESQAVAVLTSTNGQFGLSLNPFQRDGKDYFAVSSNDTVVYQVVGGVQGATEGEASLKAGGSLVIHLSVPAVTPSLGSSSTKATPGG